jgi:hypothetical protein
VRPADEQEDRHLADAFGGGSAQPSTRAEGSSGLAKAVSDDPWLFRTSLLWPPVVAGMTILAGVLMLVAVFLPTFTSTGSTSVSRNAFELGANGGFSVEGIVGVVLGIVTLWAGISRFTPVRRPAFGALATLAGIAAGLLALVMGDAGNHLVQQSSSNGTLHNAAIGPGVLVMAVGALVTTAGGLFLLITARASR